MKNVLQNSKLNNNNNGNRRFNETTSPNFKMIDGSTLSKISITSMKLFDSSDNDSNYSVDQRSLPKIKSTINNYTKLADMKKLNKINFTTHQSSNIISNSPRLEKQFSDLFKKSASVLTSRGGGNTNINPSLPSISTNSNKPVIVNQPILPKPNDVLSSLRLSSMVDQVNELKSTSRKKQPLIEFFNNLKKENIKFNERRKRLNLNLIHLASTLPNKSANNKLNHASSSTLNSSYQIPQKDTSTRQIITKNPVKQNTSHPLMEAATAAAAVARQEKIIQKSLLFNNNLNYDQFSESSETIRLLAPNPSVNTSIRDLNEFSSSNTIKSSEYDDDDEDDFDEIDFDFDLNDNNNNNNELMMKQAKNVQNHNQQINDEFTSYFQLVKNRKLNLIDESSYKYNRFNI